MPAAVSAVSLWSVLSFGSAPARNFINTVSLDWGPYERHSARFEELCIVKIVRLSVLSDPAVRVGAVIQRQRCSQMFHVRLLDG
jgi:hypothetical protein